MTEPRDVLAILDEISRLEIDPTASQRAIERARAAVIQLPQPAPRRVAASWARSFVGATAACIAVLALVHWLMPTGSSHAIAFAEVQRQVAQTKTVQFTETNTVRLKDGRKVDGYVKQVQILGKYLKREAFTPTPKDPPAEGETSAAPRKYLQILDALHGKLIGIDPERKTFNQSTTILSIEPDSDKVVESKVAPDPQVDFYAQFRDLPADQTRSLPPRNIGLEKAIGFLVETQRKRQCGTDTIIQRYWIDPATKLPLRIESTFTSTDPGMAGSEWIKTDFTFDAPLDPALFSTDPPEGYTDAAAPQKSD